MESVFRFWGFRRSTFERAFASDGVFDQRSCADGPTLFGWTEFSGELLDRMGPFRDVCAAGWSSWFVGVQTGRVRGEPLATLRLPNGSCHPLVSRNDTERITLHFDVDATLEFIQNELHFEHAAPLHVRLGLTRLALPSWVRKNGLRALQFIRTLRQHKNPSTSANLRDAYPFPNHPLDPAVDAWRWLVRDWVQSRWDDFGVPLWPYEKKAVVVLTHDIDTSYCFSHPDVLKRFREIEERAGVRSAWMVVTKLLDIGRGAIEDLHRAGHEIGFHGTHHDHRLAFLSREAMRARLRWAIVLRERFGAKGFRSPNYLRTPTLFEELDGLVDYDMTLRSHVQCLSSLKATSEGCATTMPFQVARTRVLEIPNTIPEDVGYELRGRTPAQALQSQLTVFDGIKARGGVASIVTHPEPQLSAREPWLNIYQAFVEHVAADKDVWVCRPGDLCDHWRQRERLIDVAWDSRKTEPTTRSPELCVAR